MDSEPFEIASGIAALRDRGATDREDLIVLAHGAGAPMDSPFMASMARALAARGHEVVRFNFPYMQSGRRVPGNVSRSEDCYRTVVDQLRDGRRIFIGGKSYGGRVASHIAAQGIHVTGLVFLGYPLHPPGKPEKLRDGHLGEIRAPMLFLQGTRDPFATRDLMEGVVSRLPGAELFWVDGGGHSFDVRGAPPGRVIDDLAGQIARFVRETG